MLHFEYCVAALDSAIVDFKMMGMDFKIMGINFVLEY